ncbi:MAG: hypothetical protein Q7R83_03650 [bacterium]|nr:hypothetical protein [bacterium]
MGKIARALDHLRHLTPGIKEDYEITRRGDRFFAEARLRKFCENACLIIDLLDPVDLKEDPIDTIQPKLEKLLANFPWSFDCERAFVHLEQRVAGDTFRAIHLEAHIEALRSAFIVLKRVHDYSIGVEEPEYVEHARTATGSCLRLIETETKLPIPAAHKRFLTTCLRIISEEASWLAHDERSRVDAIIRALNPPT